MNSNTYSFFGQALKWKNCHSCVQGGGGVLEEKYQSRQFSCTYNTPGCVSTQTWPTFAQSLILAPGSSLSCTLWQFGDWSRHESNFYLGACCQKIGSLGSNKGTTRGTRRCIVGPSWWCEESKNHQEGIPGWTNGDKMQFVKCEACGQGQKCQYGVNWQEHICTQLAKVTTRNWNGMKWGVHWNEVSDVMRCPPSTVSSSD